MSRSKRTREHPNPEPARQPLGTIDAILAKHPGDWKACVDELRVVEESLMRRGNDAARIVDLCRENLIQVRAQIAVFEKLQPAA